MTNGIKINGMFDAIAELPQWSWGSPENLDSDKLAEKFYQHGALVVLEQMKKSFDFVFGWPNAIIWPLGDYKPEFIINLDSEWRDQIKNFRSKESSITVEYAMRWEKSLRFFADELAAIIEIKQGKKKKRRKKTK